ncbi:hypothetical protein Bca52824_085666 [Brassica carinata]|uniref:ZN622/Rei1/Reh1 zinc finger C2H2-type domain-containing protein n=1 Tax=Brassica carinata TaxID=52824 RepID=A0A8X7P8J8_BRACI|nr:hypothetical protein Bca52824_085666 [Brassica carinata]
MSQELVEKKMQTIMRASHLPLGLKVKRDFMCLYCSELCQAFSSLEAVRKHMEAKSHCKLHYGDCEEDAMLLVSFYKENKNKKAAYFSNKSNQNKHSTMYAAYAQFQVTFATDCSQLVKMVSEPEELPAFGSYLEDIKILKRSFLNSDIVHVPQTENL